MAEFEEVNAGQVSEKDYNSLEKKGSTIRTIKKCGGMFEWTENN